MPERELKRVALLYGLGDVSLRQVEAELAARAMIARVLDGRKMATAASPCSPRSGSSPALPPKGWCGETSRHAGGISWRGQLNDGQWNAVRGLLQSSTKSPPWKGRLAPEIHAIWRRIIAPCGSRAERFVTPATPPRRRWRFSAKMGTRRDGGTFPENEKLQAAAGAGMSVVDEASMLGHRSAFALFQAAKANDLRVTLLGDVIEHGAIDRGATLRVLKTYGGIEPFRLDGRSGGRNRASTAMRSKNSRKGRPWPGSMRLIG